MSRPFSKVRLGLIVLIFLIIVIASSKLLRGPLHNFKFSSALGISSTFSFVFQSSKLSKIVQDELLGKKGDYAIYIEDLNDGEVYTMNSYDTFPAASLYKLFLIAAVLKEVENGQLSLEDNLSASKSHLADVFGEVDYGYEAYSARIEYSVQEALERVGRISDNFAAIMLAEKIGWEKIQEAADEIGTVDTTITSPILTNASDIALYLKALHNKQIVSPSTSEKITEFLMLNQISNRIPAGIIGEENIEIPLKLPEGMKIVHKTGELLGVRHDAGIIYLQDRAYILVMMSKNLVYEDEGIETLVNISQKVYQYFKEKEY